MRWLIYASNEAGHLSRVLALARQIRLQAPESEFLFMTDSQAVNAIWQEGFASVTLLPEESEQRGIVDVRQALNPLIATAAFAQFRPDVIIADTHPMGRFKELDGIFPTNLRRALVYLDRREAVLREPEFRADIGLYDLLLLPYERDEAAVPDVDGPSPIWGSYFLLRTRAEALPRETARRRLRLPGNAFVVCVGLAEGPQSGDRLRWALKQADRHPEWLFAIHLPPFASDDISDSGQANVVAFSDFPLAELLPAFDAAISDFNLQAMAELLHHGIPAIFVPTADPIDNQAHRAELVRAKGAGLVVEAFDDGNLDSATDSLADEKRRATLAAAGQAMIWRNGAEGAAGYLLSWAAGNAPRSGFLSPMKRK